MARQTAAITPKQMAVGRRGAKTYPSVPVERLLPPPDLPALQMRGVQISLWQRLRRSLWFLGIGAAAFVTMIVLGATSDLDTGAASTAFGFAVPIWLIASPIGLIGTFRVGRIAWRLRDTAWTAYRVTHFQMRPEQPITMTLVDGAKRYPVRIMNSKRAETLRGMIRPQIWFIGDPAGSGILTPAGGHTMLWTHPDRTPQIVTRLARQRTGPTKPVKARPTKPPKPIDPAKALKQAAKAKQRAQKERELAAKVAARHQAWIAKHPPKPAAPAKPAKPPKLPRIRGGQKIKWQ